MTSGSYTLYFILALLSFSPRLTYAGFGIGCTSPSGVAGQIYYASGSLKFCDGSSWKNTIAISGSSCSGTTAGTLSYASGNLRFCNGSNWMSVKGGSLGSCAGVTAGSFNWSGSTFRYCDGTNWFNMFSSSTPPTGLSLTHSANSKNFWFSWTAGSGNGGAGGCRLQYYQNASTWTNISGTFNCDANQSNVFVSLPGDNWTNNFNATGVNIRIQRISDSSALGTFSEKLLCYSTGSSSSPTPTYDENCNGVWDDSQYTVTTSCTGTCHEHKEFYSNTVCSGSPNVTTFRCNFSNPYGNGVCEAGSTTSARITQVFPSSLCDTYSWIYY
jgi:hypothetical protein